jgi:hypothetical protein
MPEMRSRPLIHLPWAELTTTPPGEDVWMAGTGCASAAPAARSAGLASAKAAIKAADFVLSKNFIVRCTELGWREV